MCKKKISVILLFSVLSNLICLSQNIPNGYYSDRYSSIYIYNDTIILFYGTGTFGISIIKGVLNHKKYIHFIPFKNKIENSYRIVEQTKNNNVSILRFNLYDYYTNEIYSAIYDGSDDFTGTLMCEIKYITPQKTVIKQDTTFVYNGKYFEIILENNTFVKASLTIQGTFGDRLQYATVPILKDTLLFVDIVRAPLVSYPDKPKKMRYKYSKEEQSISIKFDFRFDDRWHKYVKSEMPNENYWYKREEEWHINEMKKE